MRMKTKLLFLCSENADRTACAEAIFQNSDKYKAKSATLPPFKENLVTGQALAWADIIFIIDEEDEKQKKILLEVFPEVSRKKIITLNISKEFSRYDKELYRLMREALEKSGINLN